MVTQGSSLTKQPPPPTLKVSQEQGGERQSTHPAIYCLSQEGHISRPLHMHSPRQVYGPTRPQKDLAV